MGEVMRIEAAKFILPVPEGYEVRPYGASFIAVHPTEPVLAWDGDSKVWRPLHFVPSTAGIARALKKATNP